MKLLHLCRFPLLLLLGLLPWTLLAQTSAGGPAAWLSESERAWLEQHPVIRLAPAPHFPPIEFFDGDGQYRGIAADYIKELERSIGVRFEIVRLETWSQAVERAQSRDVDMWAEAAVTPEREGYMTFTRPYLELPAVIVTRADHIERTNMKELAGRKVAVVENYAVHDWMRERFPDVIPVPVPNVEEGLRLVAYGQADAIIEANAPVIYYIERGGFTNLHVAGDSGFVWRLAMAVRSDWAPLRDILQKALDRIPAQRKSDIFQNWVALKQYGWAPSTSLLLTLAAVVLTIFVAAVLAWNRALKQMVEVRTQALQQKLKEVELAHQASYRKDRSLYQLFDAVDLPLTLHELDGDLIQMNNPALELFEVRQGDLDRIRFPQDFTPPGLDIRALADVWERVVAGSVERFSWVALRPGSRLPLRLYVCCRRIELPNKEAVLISLHMERSEDDQPSS